MCQILAGKANKVIPLLLNTKGLIEDLFKHNSDGIGAMYTTSKRRLRTPRCVPKDARQARSFISTLPDDERNIVIHFRYGTSGDVDTSNAHPFVVIENEVAMTHNGVLFNTPITSTMCDTRHYIEDTIAPCLKESMGLLKCEAWLDLLSESIGNNNRFVFMDKHGELAFVNRDTGYDVADIWIANTYSFDATLLGFEKPTPKYAGSYRWSRDDLDYMDQDWGSGRYVGSQRSGGVVSTPASAPASSALATVTPITHDDDEKTAENVWEAVAQADVPALVEILMDRPSFVLRTLLDSSEFICSVNPDTDLGDADARLVKMLIDGDMRGLVDYAWKGRGATTKVAEVICWYGSWVGITCDDDDEFETTVPVTTPEGSDAPVHA